jgi:hypothetical protein
MASSAPWSWAASGSSPDALGDVPHSGPSHSANVVVPCASRMDASDCDTSYFMAGCTVMAPAGARPAHWLCGSCDCRSAPVAQTKAATTIASVVMTLDPSARLMERPGWRKPQIIKYTSGSSKQDFTVFNLWCASARYTSPIPPAPSRATLSYGPRFCPRRKIHFFFSAAVQLRTRVRGGEPTLGG